MRDLSERERPELKPQEGHRLSADVDDRRRAEAEIKRLKEFNERIVQHMAEGIAMEDAEGNLTFINPAGAALLGYTPEELRGQHWTKIIPLDQRPLIVAADERRARGEADRYEVEVIRKDGVRVPVQVSGSPQYDSATGRFLGTLAVFTNISTLKQAEAGLRQQTRQQATLNRAMQALSASLDLPRVLAMILSELQQVVAYDSAAVLQLEGDVLEIVGGHGFPNIEELLGVQFGLTDEGTPNAVVIRTCAPLIVEDAPARYSGFHQPIHAKARIRGWLGVPMLFGDRIIGMLTLDKHEPGFYTDEHAQLALAFAAQAAIALENARLYRAEQQRRLLAETLGEVSRALNASLDRERILTILLEQLARVVAYDSASLMLLSGDELAVVAHRDLRHPDPTSLRFRYMDLDNLREAVTTRQPVIVADTQHDPRWRWLADTERYIRCWLGVPLIVQERVIGLLNLDKAEPGFYTAHHAEMALAFAHQAALAMENARLYSAAQQEVGERQRAEAALRRRNDYLAALAETMLDLSSRLNLDDILESIVRRAGQLLGTPHGFIDLLEPESERLIPRVAVGALSDSIQYEVKPGEGLAGKVWATGQPLVVNDYDAWTGRIRDFSYNAIRAVVGAPLKSGGRVVGVLGLAYDANTPRTFDAEAVDLLSRFAELAAVALDNAQLFSREQERAAQLHLANERLQAQIVEIEGLHAQLREQAIRDYLTGLFNRRYLAETLERELAQAARDHAPLSIVLMDIDHFKNVNDSFGHKAGDVVLQALGHLLHTHTRQGDIACRYGGEEFVVVMPGASPEAARRRAEGWRTAFEATRIPFGAAEVQVTLSLGIAAFPLHGHAADELLRFADQALYIAKSEGRNRVVIWDEAHRQRLAAP
jgi:diguanylate cyclase (GGDEF)-like protein/PAS domain S-box-containing protein